MFLHRIFRLVLDDQIIPAVRRQHRRVNHVEAAVIQQLRRRKIREILRGDVINPVVVVSGIFPESSWPRKSTTAPSRHHKTIPAPRHFAPSGHSPSPESRAPPTSG